ncbi:unnamed protein product [Rotaria socialis]|uniref:Uncharacterized protein n=1 Tax=Rotaria socialis TaxID=392032 RepID=A0A820XWH5_9BILA|nr:unnamed protein product [Rotaria socialis]CAF3383552.1 unnamed protein product [Rotaria socialis]CAF3428356.1 unnamed protein product [Rotaria socialis]CAF3501935.1 unnamed protein product [Rotaria socialis]CAF3530497.1 unnamed protein product [Rotaria socialis]
MPTDYWMILAYVMIFSSIILCGLVPMILRLYNARQDFYHDHSVHQAAERSSRNACVNSKSNYGDEQLALSDINYQRLNSYDRPNNYTQIPFIDDEAFV